MIDALLNFDFIRYSLISGLLIGFIAPLIGAFIVVRRLSLIADALSHVTLGGISFGMFLLTIIPVFSVINPMWFGILFAVIGALLIEKLRTSFSNYQEIAIPIIMSAGIALSAIFISLADGFNQEIVGLLFGSISAVNISDLTTIIIIAIIVLIFPIAISMRITKGFKQLIALSVILGELSVILGLIIAFYMNISPGGVIVVLLVLMLILTMIIQKLKIKFKKGVV